MSTLWSIVSWLFWLVVDVLWWIAAKLFWLLLWFVLPFLVLAFIAVRVADKVLGRDVVQGWVKRQSLRFGKGTWRWVHQGLFALGALPVRVLYFLVVYTFWHSLLSLLWTPRWKPWERAWSRRWRGRET